MMLVRCWSALGPWMTCGPPAKEVVEFRGAVSFPQADQSGKGKWNLPNLTIAQSAIAESANHTTSDGTLPKKTRISSHPPNPAPPRTSPPKTDSLESKPHNERIQLRRVGQDPPHRDGIAPHLAHDPPARDLAPLLPPLSRTVLDLAQELAAGELDRRVV